MKNLSVRLDEKTLEKLHFIADYYGRSATKQAFILIRNFILKFEEKHGEITFKTSKKIACVN